MADMASPTDQPGEPALTDHEVVDEHHVHVGKVTDVIYDERDFRPRWATVKVGFLRGEHVAPLEGSYLSDEGRLVLPFDREIVRQAPKAPRGHIMTDDVRNDVEHHYAMA
jgi:hypothetical protein